MDKHPKPLLIEPKELGHYRRSDLLIADVRPPEAYKRGHIPDAHQISPRQLVARVGLANSRLPELSRLKELFGDLGLKDTTLVVAYDNEGGGWAGRLAWTLDMVGHYRWGYLNGGLRAWVADGMPVITEAPARRKPNPAYSPELRPEHRMEAEELMKSLKDVVVWDARSAREHRGTKITAARNGRIPGALNLEWTDLIDRKHGFRLRTDLTELLEGHQLKRDSAIVTHCQSHHRSALTYMAARLVGYKKIRGYDGSWSEWGNRRDTPVAWGDKT